MKKFIAFNNNQVSGILTKDEAKKWAVKQITNGMPKAYVAEVVEVVEREALPIKTSVFLPEPALPIPQVSKIHSVD